MISAAALGGSAPRPIICYCFAPAGVYHSTSPMIARERGREGLRKRINIRLLRGSVRVRIFEIPSASALSLLPRLSRSSIPSYSLNQTKNVSDFPYLPPKNHCRFCPLGIGMRREIDERIPSRYHSMDTQYPQREGERTKRERYSKNGNGNSPRMNILQDG